LGDTVRLKVLEGERKTHSVVVAGLVEDLVGLQVYMDRTALERLLGEGPSINTALLRLDPSARPVVEQRLNQMPKVAVISSRPSIIANFREQSGTSMFVISAVLTAFAATIAIGVVYNNARVALSLRSRDLASLRVLGFSRSEISGILLSELALQVLVALPLGVLLSRWFTSWVVSISHPERFRLPDDVSSQRLAFAVLVTVLSAVVSGLLVRRKLDHLDLVAVLKTRE
jgi:putative ABC transport system permease protein